MDTLNESTNGALAAAIKAEVARQFAEIEGLAPVPPHVATHECAHAVVGALIGDQPIVAVEVGRADGLLGRVRRVSLLEGAGADAVELRRRCRVAIVSLNAGLEADLRLGVASAWSGARADRALIAVLSEALPGEERDRIAECDRLRVVSRGLVAEAWPLVEGLARLLAAKRRLTGAEAEAYLATQPLAIDLRLLYAAAHTRRAVNPG